MAGSPKKLCAIDFNFLLLLEADKVECVSTFNTLEARKFQFIFTEGPLRELHEMATRIEAADFAKFASTVWSKLRSTYGILTPGLSPVLHDCAQITSEFLLDKIFAEGTSRDTALAVVEASLHESTCLLTLDQSLSKIDNSKLNAALVSRDCNPIWIFNPELAPLDIP